MRTWIVKKNLNKMKNLVMNPITLRFYDIAIGLMKKFKI